LIGPASTGSIAPPRCPAGRRRSTTRRDAVSVGMPPPRCGTGTRRHPTTEFSDIVGQPRHRSAGIEVRHRTQTTSTSSSPPLGIGCCAGGSSMIPSGLTPTVIGRSRLGNEYIRVRDSGLITAVAQFLYDEAALLDEWRLDEWLALFHL